MKSWNNKRFDLLFYRIGLSFSKSVLKQQSGAHRNKETGFPQCKSFLLFLLAMKRSPSTALSMEVTGTKLHTIILCKNPLKDSSEAHMRPRWPELAIQ